jgi:hypothetical protein
MEKNNQQIEAIPRCTPSERITYEMEDYERNALAFPQWG